MSDFQDHMESDMDTFNDPDFFGETVDYKIRSTEATVENIDVTFNDRESEETFESSGQYAKRETEAVIKTADVSVPAFGDEITRNDDTVWQVKRIIERDRWATKVLARIKTRDTLGNIAEDK